MEIEFDPIKNEANSAKHGSFEQVRAIDLLGFTVLLDQRGGYGETRFCAFGRMDGRAVCLFFTVRGTMVRPISFRPAHAKEMRRYGQ